MIRPPAASLYSMPVWVKGNLCRVAPPRFLSYSANSVLSQVLLLPMPLSSTWEAPKALISPGPPGQKKKQSSKTDSMARFLCTTYNACALCYASGASLRPYMALRCPRQYHQASQPPIWIVLPLISLRCLQTLRGGHMQISLRGAVYPFLRRCSSTSRRGDPLRKAPEASHVSSAMRSRR